MCAQNVGARFVKGITKGMFRVENYGKTQISAIASTDKRIRSYPVHLNVLNSEQSGGGRLYLFVVARRRLKREYT